MNPKKFRCVLALFSPLEQKTQKRKENNVYVSVFQIALFKALKSTSSFCDCNEMHGDPRWPDVVVSALTCLLSSRCLQAARGDHSVGLNMHV